MNSLTALRLQLQRILLLSMLALAVGAACPQPARATWLFSYPPNMVTLTSGHRNNVFYVGQTISFSMVPSNYGTYNAAGSITYEVRDYFGNTVDSGSVLAPTPTTSSSLTCHVTAPGWYKLMLHGPTSFSPWGNSVGSANFCIFRNNVNFPVEPSPNAPNNSAVYDGDSVARGVCGIGPQRHYVSNVADSTDAIPQLQQAIATDEQYYMAFDPQRKRQLLIEFPNGVGNANPTQLAANLAGLKAIVQVFHTQVKYWEPLNEPNNSETGAQYVQNELIPFYNTVKSVDPTCKVIGPAVVTIGPYGLNWLQGFFAAGGGKYIDALSFHAYNDVLGDLTLVNESFAGLNQLLAQYGLQNIEKWQTEQGYFAACYGAYEPRLQGRWTMMQMMTFEQNGIPKEHNVLWYDVANGFWDEPAFFEDADGLYSYGSLEPSAALMRVWSEELYGTNFSQAYDFGVTGDKMYIGSLFTGPGKSVAAFMGNGRTDGAVTLNVSSGTTLNVVSAFGVASTIPVTNGTAVLPVPEIPVYVELQQGQTISVQPLNLGQDLALQPGVTASASGDGLSPVNSSYPNPISKITNGILENWYYNQGNGDFPWFDDTPTFPAWVQINLPSAQQVSHVIIYSGVPWQQESSLLDYDLQYLNSAGQWVTINHTVEPTPTEDFFSPPVFTTVDSYYSDRSIFEHDFPAVTTSAIRLLVNNTTYGGAATSDVVAAGGQPGPHNIELREVEIYGPGGATATPPATPTGLVATAGNAQVSLSWQPVSAATSYNVQRGTVSGGPYARIASPTTSSYTDTAVTNGTTYYYVVSGSNSGGFSGNSNEASATPQTPVAPPSAPSGLNATAGNAVVSLAWTGASGANSYNIKRSTTNGSGYATVGSSTVSSYRDTTVSNGTPYYYVVTAVGTGGESGNSNQASATPQAPVLPPSAPSGLNATVGNATVSLTWTGVFGATSYSVKRSTTNGGSYASIGSSATASYTDSTVNNGTTYYYVVAANGAGGSSGNSNQATANPQAPATGSITLTAVGQNVGVTLSWSAYPSTQFYVVQRSTTNGGPYSTVANIWGGGTSYGDPNVNNGVTYYYIVYAITNSGAQSPVSNQASATPNPPGASAPPAPPAPAPPASPSGLAASAGNAVVKLTWNTVSGATSYNVKRSTSNGGSYSTIGTSSVGSYTDALVSNGTTYYYVVSAVGAGGESANSGQASATPQAPPTPPAAPSGLNATGGNATISLTWSGVSGATSYNVKRSTTNGGAYTTIGSAASGSYTDNTVTNGTTYYYVVTAIGTGGESGNSNQASATPQAPAPPPTPPVNPPAPPTGNGIVLTATGLNVGVNLSWTTLPKTSFYAVYRATSSAGPFTNVANMWGGSAYGDPNVNNGTKYYYYVVGNGTYGTSAPSNTATATPNGSG